MEGFCSLYVMKLIKTPIKEAKAEIKTNYMRFISITLLFVMAAMLYSGFFAVQPSFYKTMDEYSKEYNMSNVTLFKDEGFSREECHALKNNKYIKDTTETHYTDVITDTNKYFKGVRIKTLPDKVDKLWLLKGRLPSKDNECVVLPGFLYDNKLKIGDFVEITNYRNKSLKHSKLKITGTVQSPIYARYESLEGFGKSKVGMGYVYYAMYVTHDAFTDNKINQISLTLTDTESKEYNEVFGNDVEVVTSNEYTVTKSFHKDMERVMIYAKTLPNLFVSAALIICIIAIVRIIYKDKKQIGIMKSMGYQNSVILIKYSLYGSFACTIGLITGTILGVQIIPRFIYRSYEELYYLPELIISWTPVRAIIFCVLTLLGLNILIALTVLRTLRKNPNELLKYNPDNSVGAMERPRYFSLNLWLVWNHITFSGKRALFTCISLIISIMLLINAFSIFGIEKGIRDIQFNEIAKYDYMGIMNGEKQTRDFVENLNEYMSVIKVDAYPSCEANVKGWGNVNMISASPEELDDYLNIRSVESEENIRKEDNGIIITALMAEKMELKQGDTISLSVKNGSSTTQADFTINCVMENYWDNYIIMTPKSFSKIVTPKEQKFMVFANIPTIFGPEADPLKDLLETNQDFFDIVIPTGEMNQMLLDTLRAVTFFGYLLIAFATLIAMVTLWNLIDIILSERKNEQYIYSSLGYPMSYTWRLYLYEILGMALISLLPAIIMGRKAFMWLITVIENDTTMLVRPEGPLVYALSGVVTFLLIILIIVYKRLRNNNLTVSG